MNTSDPMIGETDIDPPQDTRPTDAAPLLPPEAGVMPAAVRAEPPLLAPDADARAIAGRLRAEFSEIAAVAAQAARLGIEIDAADAMRRGLKPDALRQTILDKLAVRSEAADVLAIAPQPATAGESPIVKRARERAAAGSR